MRWAVQLVWVVEAKRERERERVRKRERGNELMDVQDGLVSVVV